MASAPAAASSARPPAPRRRRRRPGSAQDAAAAGAPGPRRLRAPGPRSLTLVLRHPSPGLLGLPGAGPLGRAVPAGPPVPHQHRHPPGAGERKPGALLLLRLRQEGKAERPEQRALSDGAAGERGVHRRRRPGLGVPGHAAAPALVQGAGRRLRAQPGRGPLRHGDAHSTREGEQEGGPGLQRRHRRAGLPGGGWIQERGLPAAGGGAVCDPQTHDEHHHEAELQPVRPAPGGGEAEALLPLPGLAHHAGLRGEGGVDGVCGAHPAPHGPDPCLLREALLRQRAETEDDGQRQAPAAPGAAPRVQVPGPRPAAALAAARPAGPHTHLPGGWLPPMMAHLWTLALCPLPSALCPLPSALRGRGPPFPRFPGWTWMMADRNTDIFFRETFLGSVFGSPQLPLLLGREGPGDVLGAGPPWV